MLRSFHIGIVLLFALATAVTGQEPQHIIFNTSNGLPSKEVYDVHEDRYGYLWFTTDRGIARYDGYAFHVFTTKDGLTDNTHFRMAEDHRGGLYFPALDGTINYYNRDTFRCVHKMTNPAEVEFRYVETMYTDADGNIYLYYNRCLDDNWVYYKTNIRAGIPERIPVTKEKIKIWFRESDSKILTSLSGRINIQTVYINGSYIVLAFTKAEALQVINKELTKITTVKFPSEILIIYKDGNDLWVGTLDGLFYYKNADLTKAPSRYFRGESVTGMVKDRENIYWLSTLQSGVIEVPDFNIKMLQVGKNDIENRVQRLAPHGNEMALGIQNGGIWIIDSSLKPMCILDTILYNKNIIWESGNQLIGTNFILSRAHRSGAWQYKRGNATPLAVFSNKDVAWGHFGGIDIKKNGKDIFLAYNIGLQYTLLCAVEDCRKTIWIGTNKGIWTSPAEQYSFKKFNTIKELENVRINTIKEHPHANLLLIGTMGKGMALFDPVTGRCKFITRSDGLVSDLVHCILLLNDTVLLAGTNMGLSKFIIRNDKGNYSVQNTGSYTTTDGLTSNYISDIAMWRDLLWIATDKGLTSLDPALLDKPLLPPYVYIDSLVTPERSYRIAGNPIPLTHKNNSLSIFFTGLCKNRPVGEAFYRYSIYEPGATNKTWVYSHNRAVSFSSLPPGNYLFEVQARNKNNAWSNPAQISFVIHPHFTQAGWFRLGLAAITGMLIWLAINMRIRFLKRRQMEIQLLQKTELRAKTAELNMLRNQMNPHFLYNALNSIQNFVFKKDFQLANNYLISFARLVRDTLQQSEKGWVSLGEEVRFLENYLSLEKMRFGDKFNYEICTGNSLRNDIYLPALLLQPLLENAVKHAFKNTAAGGFISVVFEYRNEHTIRVKIRDNGIGIKHAPPKNTGRSMGIKIVRERIELLDKEYPTANVSMLLTDLSIDTSESGTVAEMILPVLTTMSNLPS